VTFASQGFYQSGKEPVAWLFVVKGDEMLNDQTKAQTPEIAKSSLLYFIFI
jgi:hypothetical protein